MMYRKNIYNTLKSGSATLLVGTNTDDSTPDIKYTISDHLNSSSVVTTDNGTLVNREEYLPFGETAFGSYAKKKYRYTGKEKDEESGLYYYGARYYSSWTSRFISAIDKQKGFFGLISAGGGETPKEYGVDFLTNDLFFKNGNNPKRPLGFGEPIGFGTPQIIKR